MAAILGEELMRQAMADLSWSRKVLVDMVANGNDCGSLLRYLTLYKIFNGSMTGMSLHLFL